MIHLHHDETIAFLAAGFQEIRSFSLTYGYLMQKPAHYLPASVNVETLCAATGRTAEFIAEEEMAYMAVHRDAVMYPKLLKKAGQAARAEWEIVVPVML